MLDGMAARSIIFYLFSRLVFISVAGPAKRVSCLMRNNSLQQTFAQLNLLGSGI